MNDDETKDRSAPPDLPFVTTSHVLNQLNQNLKALSTSTEGYEPRFELQKRLPDGSTIPASSADIAYSDLQNKLDQSAKFVSSLSPPDRAIWAEDQRHVGNAYFHKADYQTAMDIYLTCLVVKEDTSLFLHQTLLPVLNNLAQCTLQLGMHKKTIEFCNIAMEEVSKYDNNHQDKDSVIATCKILFKRAKAQRLTGSYVEARQDLNQATTCLDSIESVTLYQQAIQKEFRWLESAEAEARKNRQRQKQALQKALSTKSTTPTESTKIDLFKEEATTSIPPRQYSTLRKRKRIVDSSQPVNDENKLSYFQYYCLVVARVTEVLLLWLGDEETKEQIKKRLE